MTTHSPADLAAAILADPEARNAAETGDDGRVLQRLATILPRELLSSHRVTDRELVTAFADPMAGDAFLAALEAVAASENPAASLTRRCLRWLEDASGLDIANPAVLAYLTQLANAGLVPANAVAVVSDLATVPPTITPEQVADALAPYRPDGRVGPLPPA